MMKMMLAVVAVATVCGGPIAQAQTREPVPARTSAADRDRAEPANPADLPGWMAHAVGNILDDTGKAVDEATHDRR